MKMIPSLGRDSGESRVRWQRGSGKTTLGLVTMAAGAVTAAIGILYALNERDLKRFLAFSTIENTGVIVTAFGAAMTFGTGIPARSVWDRLRAHGVRMRTRGALNREDRLTIAPELLTDMYIRAGLPSDEVGKILGVSRRIVLRTAHDEGLPVRMGGPEPRRGPSEIELINALYSDPDVRGTLRRYNVPQVAPGGPIWQRFPDPVPLSKELARDLYDACGLATTHIELLTGQPADSVRKALRKAAAPLRPGGGRSPFFRRWRASQADPRIPGDAPLRRKASSLRGLRSVSVSAAKKPDSSRPGLDGSQIPSREDEQAGSGEPSCWLRTGER